jgi:hypothetical protein
VHLSAREVLPGQARRGAPSLRISALSMSKCGDQGHLGGSAIPASTLRPHRGGRRC